MWGEPERWYNNSHWFETEQFFDKVYTEKKKLFSNHADYKME